MLWHVTQHLMEQSAMLAGLRTGRCEKNRPQASTAQPITLVSTRCKSEDEKLVTPVGSQWTGVCNPSLSDRIPSSRAGGAAVSRLDASTLCHRNLRQPCLPHANKS